MNNRDRTSSVDIMNNDHPAFSADAKELRERLRFNLESEDMEMYRHTYQEEQQLLEMVREGMPEEAVRLNEEIDAHVGRFGKSELDHWRTMLIIGVTLCTRAAIEGGMLPYEAYRLSGFYINKAFECWDKAQVLLCRNHAIQALAQRVREIHSENPVSNYTEQCKDYVRRHFREKIHIEDMAKAMGISGNYLSRVFKKDTGEQLQAYINHVRVERAANLLIYSDETLAQIAEYVNFPTQSYFGKIFKAEKGMTPRQYRDTYKTAEFIEKKE